MRKEKGNLDYYKPMGVYEAYYPYVSPHNTHNRHP